MTYRLLADLVLVVHFGFILFVVFGGLFVLWRRWMAFVHLPCAVWGLLIEWRGWICPLTPLENSLRDRAGLAGYSDGFIEHYLLSTIYPTGLTREVQLALAALVVAVNVVVYAFVLRAARSDRERD